MKFKTDAELPQQKSSNGGRFLKIEANKVAQVIFRGEIYEYTSFKYKPQGAFRFRVNAIIKENGAFVAKIWEQGPMVYKMLRSMYQTAQALGGSCNDKLFDIKRQGSTQDDTKYTIEISEIQPDADELSAVNAVKLNDLAPDSK